MKETYFCQTYKSNQHFLSLGNCVWYPIASAVASGPQSPDVVVREGQNIKLYILGILKFETWKRLIQ